MLFVTIALLIYAQCNEFNASQVIYNLVVKRVMELYEVFGSSKQCFAGNKRKVFGDNRQSDSRDDKKDDEFISKQKHRKI